MCALRHRQTLIKHAHYKNIDYRQVYLISLHIHRFHHLQMVLVVIDRVNLSFTGFDFMLELNLRALLSLPVRQHLIEHLNIYALNVVYLLLSGVL